MEFKTDLHIHSVLSPCGDLDMSPLRIIEVVKEKDIKIIGITDHNTTLHAPLMVELGEKNGIHVVPGVELNTAEEVHCLAFFESIEKTKEFQLFIEANQSAVKNKPDFFGEQLLVNEKEEILEEIYPLLIFALNVSIDDAEKKVHELNGIFIPAHIHRKSNGIIHQLGFIPENLICDAFETTEKISKKEFYTKYPEYVNRTVIRSSDAHHMEHLGENAMIIEMPKYSFSNLKEAFKNKDNIRF